MLEIFLEDNSNYPEVANFWPIKLVDINMGIDELVLIPRK